MTPTSASPLKCCVALINAVQSVLCREIPDTGQVGGGGTLAITGGFWRQLQDVMAGAGHVGPGRVSFTGLTGHTLHPAVRSLSDGQGSRVLVTCRLFLLVGHVYVLGN